MRVFGAYRDNAAWYYRVGAPFSVLRYRTEHEFRAGGLSLEALAGCDVLWLQQHCTATTEVIVREFQAAGGRVVYDVDDWLFGLPPSWPCYDQYFVRGSGEPRERLIFHERLLGLADVVTCSTERLAGNLRERLGPDKRIKVLPNCILQGDWDTVLPVGHGLEGPVLGWFGTGNHWDDWAEVVDAVDQALEAVGGHLALIGAPELVAMFPERLAARTVVHPLVGWKRFDEVRRLVSAFDVGLAWCTDRLEANACRSPLKAIQYGAAGVPVVASWTVYGELPGGWEFGLGYEDCDYIPVGAALTSYGVVVQNGGSLSAALEMALGKQTLMVYHANAWQEEVWRSHSYEGQALRWLGVVGSMK